ncbi:MAG: hypothetical protein MJZ03_03530 [archaeon]|nr:hypothetical protein [archaeon]
MTTLICFAEKSKDTNFTTKCKAAPVFFIERPVYDRAIYPIDINPLRIIRHITSKKSSAYFSC